MRGLTDLELAYLQGRSGPLASSWAMIAASKALLNETEHLVKRDAEPSPQMGSRTPQRASDT